MKRWRDRGRIEVRALCPMNAVRREIERQAEIRRWWSDRVCGSEMRTEGAAATKGDDDGQK